MSDFKDTEHSLYLALADVKRLAKRIEELEQFQQSLHPTELRDYMRTYYIITDEQIDAAVKIARSIEEHYSNESGWETLKPLGIFRCEGCDGAGKTYSRSSSMKEEPMEWVCPDCNGHGWVIGGEDE